MAKKVKVKCPACDRQQEDKGQSITCIRCGFCPVLSYSYPVSHVSHPDFKRKKGQGQGQPTALKPKRKKT